MLSVPRVRTVGDFCSASLESVDKSRVEDIKHSMDDQLSAIKMLCEAGMVEEVNILLGALQELKKLVSCIKVCDDGDVLMVH